MPRTRTMWTAASLALTGVMSLALPAAATSEPVTVAPGGDLSFAPETVGLPVGGVVEWTFDGAGSPSHSVHQVKGLFDSGDPTSDPFEFGRTLSAGVFKYECETHPTVMQGTVKGKPVVLADPESGLPLVQWAVESSNTGGRFDVQYKVGSGDWRDWLKNTAKREKVFGADGSPVEVKLEKTYKFRARSQKGTDNTLVSGWSPSVAYFHNPT